MKQPSENPPDTFHIIYGYKDIAITIVKKCLKIE